MCIRDSTSPRPDPCRETHILTSERPCLGHLSTTHTCWSNSSFAVSDRDNGGHHRQTRPPRQTPAISGRFLPRQTRTHAMTPPPERNHNDRPSSHMTPLRTLPRRRPPDPCRRRRIRLVGRHRQASTLARSCLLYTSPSPRDRQKSRMPSS